MKTNEFTEYLQKRVLSNKSVTTFQKVLNQFKTWLDQENLEAEEIRYQDMLLFIKYYQKKGVNQRTIQNYIGAINHFYNHLIEESKIDSNPTSGIEIKGIKRKQLYHILEPHELNALYNNYPTRNLSTRRNKVMLGLLVYQGLKVEDLARLETSHVQLREGEINIPGSRRSEARTLKLESHQVLDVYDYLLNTRVEILNRSKLTTELLFVGPEGGTRISSFLGGIMQTLKKLNPNVLNAKQIRASVITKWLKTHNLREVQYKAGHRYVSSTESYKQNDLEGLQEEVNMFHPLG